MAYIGQIGMFGFNFAPQGWAFCHGQLMSIGQNVPLFEVIGGTYPWRQRSDVLCAA